MKPPLTLDEAHSILASRVDAGWLAAYEATAEGTVVIQTALQALVASDAKDAALAAAQTPLAFSTAIGPPADRGSYATTTLLVTRTRPGGPITLPAGAKVRTPDGIEFTTDASLTFGALPLTVTATATRMGPLGIIPPGEITLFSPLGRGLSGAGTEVEIVHNLLAGRYYVALTTDVTQPSPFRQSLVGSYLQIQNGVNANKLVQLGYVNATGGVTDPTSPEGAYAFSVGVTSPTDSAVVGWNTGLQAYTWQMREWSEMGLSVTNTTAVVGGTYAVLDEIAKEAGVVPSPSEAAGAVRARVSRAPSVPSAIGLLREAVAAVVPFGFGRPDIDIYELQFGPPDPGDPYAANFPPWGGFITDLHCTDMPSPDTPAGMLLVVPSDYRGGAYPNPGPAVMDFGSGAPVVMVRWLEPADYPSGAELQVLSALSAGIDRGRPRGATNVQLWQPSSWLFY